MKKHAFTLLKIATIFAFLSATTSCSDIEDTKTYGDSKTASIEIQIGSAARYAITPSYEYFDQMAKITLSGKQTTEHSTYEKTWNGERTPSTYNPGETYWTSAYTKLQEDPIVKNIPLGKWEFTLECYDKDGALVCSGKTEKTLKCGNNRAITIELENVKGNGSIEIELNISEQKIKDAFVTLGNNYDITTSNYMGEVVNNAGTVASSQDSGYGIKACLKNLDGTVVKESGILPLKIPTNNPTALAYSVRYAEEEIPAGSYILSFMVYEKKDAATAESLLTTVSELVNVAPGITTNNGSLALASLNKSYPINYAKYVYKYYTGDWETNIDNFESSWLVGNVPLSYTEYDTITLPTVYDVLKPCDEYTTYDNIIYYTSYIFNGWYLNEDLTTPIEKISEKAEDVTLYAKLEQFDIYYNPSAFKGVNDDKGEISVKFSTCAAIPEDWFKQIEFSWKNGGIVSLGNTEPEFEYSQQNVTTGIFTFKNAHVLEFGSDVLIASIKGVSIAKIGVDTSVLTAAAINAFYPDAENTTEITLPTSVESIGNYAFTGCKNLKTVIINAETPPTIYSNTFDSTIENFYVPKEFVDTYKATDDWSNYAGRISEK